MAVPSYQIAILRCRYSPNPEEADMLKDEDRSGVDQARERLISAILNQDPDAYAMSFTEDGIVIHPESPYVLGRKAIRAYIAEVFRNARVTRLEVSPLIVEGNEDTAYEVSTQLVKVEPTSDQFKEERQHTHVYRKESDGVWRIAAAMSGNS
jgi:uncharacterized protein (TIGR02246 family)